MPGATAVVHTLGTLLEDTRYKSALKEGNVSGLVGAFISSIAEGSCGRNPLEEPKKGSNSYEVLNRDAGELILSHEGSWVRELMHFVVGL